MVFSKDEIKLVLEKHYPPLYENELELFLSICRIEAYQNKEIILKKNRVDKQLVIILKGAARAYNINNDGQEINSHLRAAGFIFGDPKVFTNDATLLDIEAIGETHVLKFNIEKLELLAFDYPNLMKFYLAMLKEVIVTFSHRINTFVCMDAKERYYDLIKWNPEYLKNTYDKQIATFLGITPLTLHRIKKKIKIIK